MKVQWFYRIADGVLTGDTYAGQDIEANTPPGCAAIDGVTDWRAQRVNVASGKLIDWKPPAPADDDMQAWSWDGAARRWVPSPTPAALAAQIRRERDQRLAACDWVPLRAFELSQPVPQAWRDYRQALRDLPDQPEFPRLVAWPDQPAV